VRGVVVTASSNPSRPRYASGGGAAKPLHPAESMPLKFMLPDQRKMFDQQSPASASPYTTAPKRDAAPAPSQRDEQVRLALGRWGARVRRWQRCCGFPEAGGEARRYGERIVGAFFPHVYGWR
jgi:hypothetical protein